MSVDITMMFLLVSHKPFMHFGSTLRLFRFSTAFSIHVFTDCRISDGSSSTHLATYEIMVEKYLSVPGNYKTIISFTIVKMTYDPCYLAFNKKFLLYNIE